MHPSVYLFFIGDLGHWTIKEECFEENVTLAAKEGNNKIMVFFLSFYLRKCEGGFDVVVSMRLEKM